MYKKVSNDMNFASREKEVEQFWQEHDIFQKSIELRKDSPTYMFYDGPPTANGKPHIGHVLTRVIKDMIPRYRTMKGYRVPRKAGWDTHGLPVELEVEKLLGLDGKEQIEEYGIEPFVKKCKESVWKYKGMWEDFSDTVGFWADMENPYVTYDDDFIESEWWALKEIWDKKLLYKGFKVVPYCPRCGTPLSAQEVAQGYKTVKERSAIARFKAEGEDTYFLVWTTTPWTLPSNVALCVNPNDTYCKVKAADGYTYYLAEQLLDSVLGKLAENEGDSAYEVLERFSGKELENKKYEPLFECAKECADRQKKGGFYVTCDTYVTMTDGTGIVHIAPAFGEDDANVGRNYDLPFVQFVDGKGEMTEDTPFAGLFVKDADMEVIKNLDSRGLLYDAPKFEHEYPHCWRCDKPLIYYARESWYIRETEIRDELMKNNDTVNWIPESIGKGRFGNWLENIQDWAISRNRYWGTPLNIWECECGHQECIGSREELAKRSGNPKAAEVELHRPYIDEITFTCPDCGKQMRRVPEVVDCWFDSGAMPFAQYHYPFENKELFEAQFPAQFISEAVDQTRGWFHSLMAESTLLFHKAPYENVIVLGHVQDENGQKMSKTKGNAVDPFEALAQYGADAIRWYFYVNSAPWLPNRFHGKAVTEGQRKFMSTLWNTYAFYVLYAEIDSFNPTEYMLDYNSLSVMDKWLLSRLSTTVQAVDENLEGYRIPETARALQAFVDDMSNWYVRRCRERFWAKGMEQDKINAYMTLYTALVTISKAAAPMIPFMTESIYQNLVCTLDSEAPESIHLCDFPSVKEEWIDGELESQMEQLLNIVVLGRACRNTANIKNRQPVGKLYVKAESELSDFFKDILAEELNVKECIFTNEVEDFTSYTFKPQLRTLGKRFGSRINALKEVLGGLDGSKAMEQLKADGKLTVALDGQEEVLAEEDLLIESAQKEGYVSESDRGITVVLDTALTPELIEEGFVREIISKIQTMRKDADFKVTDHIRIYQNSNEKIRQILTDNAEWIKKEVLADEIFIGEMKGHTAEWMINGEAAIFGVTKVTI